MTQSLSESSQSNYVQSATPHAASLEQKANRWSGLGVTANIKNPAAPAALWAPHPLDLVSLGLLGAAVALWVQALDGIDVRAMDDYGLIAVLPLPIFLALFLLCASFSLTLYRPQRVDRLSPHGRPGGLYATASIFWLPLALIHLVLLIFMTYGITSIVYDTPRFAIGWRLAGIIDYIMQTGTVDGRIDAFFNWPGFFMLMAFFTEMAGLDSPRVFMMWAPVIFNLLYLGPLWLVLRAATADLRLILAGMWFFYLANWIGQDYLAPQALNLFFFLMVLGILLTWLGKKDAGCLNASLDTQIYNVESSEHSKRMKGEDSAPTPSSFTPQSSSFQRVALLGLVLLLLAAMVASHQLTPFFTLVAISGLVVIRRCMVRTLPLILGIMVATWVLYVATPYVHGHVEHITSPVGSVTSNIEANLGERFRGSPEHIFINYTRIGVSATVWGLALLGGVRRLRNGYRDWALALLALAPFPILLLQAYGGELLLRIYLFSVPFMAFFCAALFYPSPGRGNNWRTTVLLGGASFVLLIGFLFARFGNDRMMYFTEQEVAAVQYLYELAAPGEQLVAGTGTLPWRFQEYRAYKYTTVPPLVRTGDLEGLAQVMRDRRYPASYLLLTRSQQASGELFIGWSPGTWEQFEQRLYDSDAFHLIYENEDARIYVLSEQETSDDE